MSMSTAVIPEESMAIAESGGMSMMSIYLILLAVGLVLIFGVLVITMLNVISINKKMDKLAAKDEVPSPAPQAAGGKNKQSSLAHTGKPCNMCGKENEEGAVFCSVCGSRL